ncbi:MAG: DUF1501 domain-containing protein [Planctomycetes bacterium]|nr:DUF1501 domain-containing protein [Planctomycetota bacterium]
MLSLCHGSGRLGRRDFLRVGGLTFGGLSLSGLLRARAAAAPAQVVRDKAVVFVFMHGGPSQVETFDPKMTASANVRSATGELATTLPGVTFGGTFPRLASLAHKLAVVRSFVTGDGNHDIKPVVGRDTAGANLGSIYARVAGTNRPVSGMPTNVLLFPPAVDPSTGPGVADFGKFDATGPLGGGFAPFIPGTGGGLQDDMKLSMPMERLRDRLGLLAQLDRVKRHVEHAAAGEGLERFREQAFQIILGSLAEAFDLSKEHPATVARYDTAPLVRPENIDRKWNNYNRYVDNAKSLGKLMLLARRLCERGCGFVTVTTNFVWDMHADVNNAGVAEGMRYMGLPFDHAISAFLEDVEARGLSDKILLVAFGEMGRTPRINPAGGRDHWGNLAPLLLAGGGLRTGQVIGQSTRDAAEPLAQPVTLQNLLGLVLHTLFDVGQLRLQPGVPPHILRMADWQPIPGLLG